MAQRIEEITVTDGVIRGPLRQSVNQAQNVEGSIHNDAVASKLGFRGGTVAGSIHLELFPPLLLRAFGESWLEHGTLSINFKNATTDREPVRALLDTPDGPQTRARVEREDGMLVAEGTASTGASSEPTALQAIDLSRFDAGELRILAGLTAGDAIEPKDVEMPRSVQDARREVITEWIDAYDEGVASPATMVHFLYGYPSRVIGRSAGKAVGLFGAIEVRNENGPLVLDRTYRVGGEILAVGQSPKTEYVWFESYAESLDGKRVAAIRMQLRWMKASSPLYG
jgi:hypothetical protein